MGIKRIRLQAGWAKTEKVKGVYDFAWLDRQVDYLAPGLDVLIETSYGNPIYPGGGGASLSDGLPSGDTGLAAWDRWIDALAGHYRDRVQDWSTWNEPSNSKGNTPEILADNNIRTAAIIKRHIPDARIAGLVLSSPNVRFAEPYRQISRRARRASSTGSSITTTRSIPTRCSLASMNQRCGHRGCVGRTGQNPPACPLGRGWVSLASCGLPRR